MADKVYKTIHGDTWDHIAYKTLGSEYLLPVLLNANPKHRETVIFSSNQTILIPDFETESTVSLPPWLEGDVT